ncbi:MAG: hypothetical protein P1U82_17145 [Verrucomicrobiales bacterium]|jgi:hypothetical protein|nr:hypothetical protein [Verrucomicrobiales bacterium]MDF1787593.1 hypothetical protein [Verrucomicrobiales bacterium]
MRRLIRDGKVSDKDIYLGTYVPEELDLNVAYEALLDHVIGETNYGPALIMWAAKAAEITHTDRGRFERKRSQFKANTIERF